MRRLGRSSSYVQRLAAAPQATAGVPGNPWEQTVGGPDAYNTCRDIDCEMTTAAPACPWRVSQTCAAVEILDQDAYNPDSACVCVRVVELEIMLLEGGRANSITRLYGAANTDSLIPKASHRQVWHCQNLRLVMPACLHTQIWPSLRNRTSTGALKL